MNSPPGLALWAAQVEREPEPGEPHTVGEPVHHQEVPGVIAGRQRPGVRGRVEAAAQRKAPHRPARPRPAGRHMQPGAGVWCSARTNQKVFFFCPTAVVNVVIFCSYFIKIKTDEWYNLTRGGKKRFLKIHNHSTTVQPCARKRHKSKCFYEWEKCENQRVIPWCR